jgi:putative SOS response-associated peptidase YedK
MIYNNLSPGESIMCGRYTLTLNNEEIKKAFNLEEAPAPFKPRYNIAPSQSVPVIFQNPNTGKCELQLFKWGLVPSWSKTSAPDYNTINARSETIHSKPAFRKAFASQRCLVPADSFFEWDHKSQPRQPMRIMNSDKSLMALAGIWDTWHGNDNGEEMTLQSFTILTTKANELLQPIHDRMPVIIEPKDYMSWLEINPPTLLPLLNLLRSYPSNNLMVYPISRAVNNPLNDTLECTLAI